MSKSQSTTLKTSQSWSFKSTSVRNPPSTSITTPWVKVTSWPTSPIQLGSLLLTTSTISESTGLSSAVLSFVITLVVPIGLFFFGCLIVCCISGFSCTCCKKPKRQSRSQCRISPLPARLPAANVSTISGSEAMNDAEVWRRGTDNEAFQDLPPSYTEAVVMNFISVTIDDDLPSYEAAVRNISQPEVNSINTQTDASCRTRTGESSLI